MYDNFDRFVDLGLACFLLALAGQFALSGCLDVLQRFPLLAALSWLAVGGLMIGLFWLLYRVLFGRRR